MESGQLELVAPRGYCAGVDRAIETVEKALDELGAPIYVRGEIVHNQHVVRTLAERGAIFVERVEEVPEGETIILSAHGSAPEVYSQCENQNLRVIDATCPLVSKVHAEVRRYAREKATVFLVGHAGHDEVIGTMGEAPDRVVLIEDLDDASELKREWFEGKQRIALTAGASAPELLVQEVADALQSEGYLREGEETPSSEGVFFALPNELRTD